MRIAEFAALGPWAPMRCCRTRRLGRLEQSASARPDGRRPLRLFLAANGVWFFRVGLMLWLVVNKRPAGFDPVTFQGPFLTFLAFAQFLLPLAVLELYLRARDGASAPRRAVMAAGLCALTLAMGGGIAAAFMGMWLPHLQ